MWESPRPNEVLTYASTVTNFRGNAIDRHGAQRRPLKVTPIHLEPGKAWDVDEAVVQMLTTFHATLSHL